MIDVEAWTRSVKLQHLRAILAIAETTSMALAAERLKLTQPAVTKILHEIEEDLGVQLCTRTSRGTHLTPSGRILADHVTLIFSQLGQAAKAIHDNREGLSGRVVVGTLIAGAASLLPSAIARLQSERPGVRVTIIEGTYDYLTPLLRQRCARSHRRAASEAGVPRWPGGGCVVSGADRHRGASRAPCTGIEAPRSG